MDVSRKSPRLFAIGYWILALMVIGVGVSRRFSIPQVPLMDKDSVGYLNPALSLYGGGPMLLEHGRNYPYPGLLFLGLRVFNDFKALAVLQHLSGILAGILALLAWNRARGLVANRFQEGTELAYRVLGLLPVLVFFVTSKNTYYELYLRPEAVLPCFVMSSLWFAVEFLRARFVEGRAKAALVYGALLVVNSAFIYFIKPSWGLNVLFGMAPVVGSIFVRTGAGERGWIFRAIPLLSGGFLAVALLFYPDHVLKKRDPMGSLFLPETLFTIHADLIQAQMEKDAEHNDTPYPSELLRETAAELRSEMDGPGKHKMGTLGFDADYLLYLSPLFPDLAGRLGDRQNLGPFCFYYYKRAFLKQPLAMSRKIGASLKAFYRAECPVFETEKKGTPLARNYSASVKLLSKLSLRSEPLERYQAICEELSKEKPVLKPSWLGRGFYEALRRAYLPSLILALTLAVLVWLSPKLRPDLGLFAGFVLLPFAYNFGTSFTVSVIHTLGIRRYIFSQQSFAVFAEFLALALALELGARSVRSRRRKEALNEGENG